MSPAHSLQDLIHIIEAETEDDSPLGRLRAASGLAGHLAEVGDAALGYFVDQARHAGHSWSQIGEALGVSKQAAQQKHTGRQPSGTQEPGFEQFTPRARRAVSEAERIARDWGHDYVGTEHLFLALYRDPLGLATQILAEAGLDEERAVARIEERVERGAGARAGALAATPKLTAVLDAARSAALELGHDHVGTEHLLIGLDRIDAVPRQLLREAGLTSELIDRQVAAKLEPYTR
jgi:hypothetical protein